jgi:hypothetical protein
MAHRLMTPGGKTLYALRKQMPEPVCGIIKSVLGFRQFLLRGLDCVRGDWRLVTSAWNLKRRFALCPSAGGEKGLPRVQINGRDEPFVVELRVLSRRMAAQPQHSEPAAHCIPPMIRLVNPIRQAASPRLAGDGRERRAGIAPGSPAPYAAP